MVCGTFAVPVTTTDVKFMVATFIFVVFAETAIMLVAVTEFETKMFPETLMAFPAAMVPTPMFDVKRVAVFMVPAFIVVANKLTV